MLGRVIAVLIALATGATASAQDMKLPDFGRYHALVIGINDYEQLPKGRITDIGMRWRET